MSKGAIVGILVALVILGIIGGGIYIANKSRPRTQGMPVPASSPPVEKTVVQ